MGNYNSLPPNKSDRTNDPPGRTRKTSRKFVPSTRRSVTNKARATQTSGTASEWWMGYAAIRSTSTTRAAAGTMGRPNASKNATATSAAVSTISATATTTRWAAKTPTASTASTTTTTTTAARTTPISGTTAPTVPTTTQAAAASATFIRSVQPQYDATTWVVQSVQSVWSTTASRIWRVSWSTPSSATTAAAAAATSTPCRTGGISASRGGDESCQGGTRYNVAKPCWMGQQNPRGRIDRKRSSYELCNRGDPTD
mmetsp:Transcript_60978/g.149301  ORF Transcript_60978/g.149301 Transcript_60978/m.149301 type:complete len:256 (+) Transcript_60978:921-1688(+)